MLGYFSLVGLLRLHSLLGDYYQAIKVLENIELNKKVKPYLVQLMYKMTCSTEFKKPYWLTKTNNEYIDPFFSLKKKYIYKIHTFSYVEATSLFHWLFFYYLDFIIHSVVLQSMYSRVPECQITTYYYVGFAYLMMRRYQDAIRVFANILLYIQRTRNMFQRSTYKYEMVSHIKAKCEKLVFN